MKSVSTRKVVLNGLFIALVFLTTYFTRIPTPLPEGYFNLGDAAIMLAAVCLGPASGLAAGALGSALADLAAGAFIFVPVTFIVKGVEGLAVGLIMARSNPLPALVGVKREDRDISAANDTDAGEKNAALSQKRLAIAVVVGAVIMMAGYFLAEAFILGMFDKAFGLAAAASELLPNGAQGVLSAILGYAMVMLVSKVIARR